MLLGASAPETLDPLKQANTVNSVENNLIANVAKPSQSDRDLSELYNGKIDSVNNLYAKKELVFDTYEENIDSILVKLTDTINSRTRQGLETVHLQPLYAKSAKKYATVKASYLIYGDGDDISLRASAEEFLSQNANDPRSVDIQQSFKCGKRKEGWVYYVRYRARNQYGALVLSDIKLLMRYDRSSQMFDILKVY